ncbi:MAG: c-type cytochrome [Woeseiaceae bacterium]
MKNVRLLCVLVPASLFFSATTIAAEVEVAVRNQLDGNLNGYCLDIKGGGPNVDPSRGLQAHTCYSYRGDLGSDQAIDPEGIANGVFKVTAFDVCATMASVEAGTEVSLAACDGSDAQQFDFADSGTISPKTAPGMCLTAGEETTMGRGGTSPHQIKTLTLQKCSDDQAAVQEWFTRTQADYNSQAQLAFDKPNESVSAEELFAACSLCHGAEGQGNIRRDGPALAGLEDWYLKLQMNNYKDGIRGTARGDVPGHVMYLARGMLRDDATVDRLADYISKLEPGIPLAANAVGERPYLWESPYAGLDASITPDAAAGEETYATICVACHGTDGKGNEALGAANLTYLHEPYMIRQLKYFRDDIRGAHPKDIRGQQMAAMSKFLADEQAIADVAAYVAGL